VVADFLGRLYRREAVLEFLLSRRGAPVDGAASAHRFENLLRTHGAARLQHLASMKDVFAVDLRPWLGGGGGGGSAGTSGSGRAPIEHGAVAAAAADALYACPITGARAGRAAMVALVPCGHILAQRALDAVAASKPAAGAAAAGGSSSSSRGGGSGSGNRAACPLCGAAYDPDLDAVVINGTEAQVEELRRRLPERRERRGGGGGSGSKRNRKAQQQQQQHQHQHQQQQQQQQEEEDKQKKAKKSKA
jgi:hypothetical protein